MYRKPKLGTLVRKGSRTGKVAMYSRCDHFEVFILWDGDQKGTFENYMELEEVKDNGCD